MKVKSTQHCCRVLPLKVTAHSIYVSLMRIPNVECNIDTLYRFYFSA